MVRTCFGVWDFGKTKLKFNRVWVNPQLDYPKLDYPHLDWTQLDLDYPQLDYPQLDNPHLDYPHPNWGWSKFVIIFIYLVQRHSKLSTWRVQDHATSPAPHGLPNPTLVWTNESTCNLSCAVTEHKLHLLSLVQTKVGFGKPCGSLIADSGVNQTKPSKITQPL